MATTTTPTPAAALANPGGYSIRIPFTAAGAYDLELTKAAAKAICADWLDPNESWADQDEQCLENALEDHILELFHEHLLNFPAAINSKLEGRAIALKLDSASTSVELECLEVEA
jgi:hypothetical protein